MKILLVALLAIGTIVSAKHIVQEKQYFRTTPRPVTTTTTRATTTTKPSTTTTTTTTAKPTTHEPVQQQQAVSTDSCEGSKTLTDIGMQIDQALRIPMDLPSEIESYRGMVDMVFGPVFPFTIPEEIIERVCWKKCQRTKQAQVQVFPSDLQIFLEQFVPSTLEKIWGPVTKTDMSNTFEEALGNAYVQITTDPQQAMTEIAQLIDTNYGQQINDFTVQVQAKIEVFMLPYMPAIQMVGPMIQPTLVEMGAQMTEENMIGVINGLMTGAINMDDPMSIPNFIFGEELFNRFKVQASMAAAAFAMVSMG